MTLTLELTPEQESRLRQKAAWLGLDAKEYAIRLLTGEELPKPLTTAQLLQSWIDEGDEEEQRETFEVLKQGLNENHSSYRQIFP